MSKEEGAKEVYKLIGAINTLRMTGNFVNAARYTLYKQMRDQKVYALLGTNWKDFCRDELGHDSDKINMEIKMLEEYGEPFLRAAEQIRLTKRELNAFGRSLSEDAKAEVKRGVIRIGDAEFKIEELRDNVEEFKANIDLLCKHKELETKEKKHLEKKLEGLEKEHKREIQAYAKENADLKALVVDPKLPEGFDALFKFAERKTDEIFMAAAKLKFEDAYGDEKTGETGRIKALYMERLTIMHNKFTNCIKRLQDSVGVELGL